MKNKPWEAVHAVFELMYKLNTQLKILPQGYTMIDFQGAGAQDGGAQVAGEDQDVTEELIEIRKDIRTQLDFLRASLAEELTERDSYLVIFPIVTLCDELIQSRYFEVSQSGWPPLQKELFQIDDAGEVFFEILEDVLRKPQTLPFIYEVFYLCLSHGFQGKYNENPVKIQEYMKKLKEKIPIDSLEDIKVEFEEVTHFNYVTSRGKVYAATGGVLAALYFVFIIIAKIL